jgi:hypothetical protein
MPDPAATTTAAPATVAAILAGQAKDLAQNLPAATAGDAEALINDGATAVEKTADEDIVAQTGKVPVLGGLAATILEAAVKGPLEAAKMELEGLIAYHLAANQPNP